MNIFEHLYNSITESLEPKKPVNGYDSVYTDPNWGSCRYKFTTTMGNKVNVYFSYHIHRLEVVEKEPYQEADVEFTVNGSVEEAGETGEDYKLRTSRDSEILSGVIYTILVHLEKDKTIKILSFDAFKSYKVDDGKKINRDISLNKNRRLIVYKQLIDRYIGNDWTVQIKGYRITLYRKH
jgi:hypothetical protein